MNKEEQIFLLSVIKMKGNLSPLRQKYTYSQIADEIKKMIEEGLVENKESIYLSEKGINKLNSLLKELKLSKRDWILPYFQYKCDTFEKDFIYLPNKIDNL